ncbi:MAG: hypothetical protein ABS75_26580 [Pelagibacterium sp. SCN 63-23]|nr:MAG: hypothetical protein ABS75_26580 [Pelagibacterium sp. SCN 63-23]
MTDLKRYADISYGAHPLRTLDIYPAQSEDESPVHIYLHGGYWRAQDKSNYAFIAGMLVEHGITAVIVNYELCPGSTLDEVVDSALAGVEWVCRNVGQYGGDPRAISLSGHSAGAHLVAEVLATDWASRGVDPGAFVGAIAVSGIYDPAPAALTSVNEELRLTPETIANRNVEARPPLVDCPVAVMVGGDEPWHWIDQSFRYSHHLHRHGRQPAVQVLPNYNHFNILMPFMQPESPIGATMLQLARSRQS